MKLNNKATNQIGIGIIAFAIILFLGGLFSNNNIENNSYNNNIYNNSNYLFQLENINLGKDQKITENYNNIILGSKKEFNLIYIGNNFILNSNPFSKNNYSFEVNFENPENVNYFLIYFKTLRSSGNENIKIYSNNKLISDNLALSNDIPIRVNQKPTNKTKIIFELNKPKIYDIFNWNKVLISNIKIVEEKQNKNNNIRKYDFNLNKNYLKQAYIQLSIKCEENKEISEPIEIKINNQIIANQNPNCISHYTTIKKNIPINILKDKNSLELKTNGLYKIAYSINKIYFNDETTYTFNINSFNNINDILLTGDFDKDIIDLKINSYKLDLERNDIKSIFKYVKYGVNKIQILTKPLEVKELTIQEITN